ncbi:MAG: alcohol dehydrogenase catalytic domain-containing protein [Syntrophobacterales bacterium]|jgi:threonine dehydrogenase-like Zn-dependent dehydrogenase
MAKPEFNTVVTVPKPRVLEIVDRPFPKLMPGSGSVIIKTEIAALCVDDKMWTDHDHEWFSHPIYGMGHEGVGVVVDAGTSTKLKDGDRVLISHGGYCGRCYSCVNLLCQAMCTNIAGGEVGTSSAPPKFFIDGLAPIERKNDSKSGWAALAQYRLADEGTCTIIADDLDFKYAIAAECSVGMAYCAQEFMKVKSGDYLLLLGNGQRQFSLSNVIVGLFRGARVIAAVRDDYQAERVLAIGKARGGTPDLHIVNMRSPDWKDKVLSLTDGNGPEKVADFTSEEEVLNAALDLLCVQGVLYIQENLYNKNRKLNIDPYAQLAEKNLTITATIDSRHIDRPGIIRMLRNKEVQCMWDEVATHEFSLAEVDKAMELTFTQQCGKVLVYPHGLPRAQGGV